MNTILILLLIHWTIGVIGGYYAQKVFNHAMQTTYPLSTPKQESVSILWVFAGLAIGILSILNLIDSFKRLPEGVTKMQALKSKAGEVYKCPEQAAKEIQEAVIASLSGQGYSTSRH